MRMFAIVLAGLIAGLSAGCAPVGGLTTGATAPRVFDLAGRNETANGPRPSSQRLRNMQVLVDEPTAVRSLDGEMILVAMSSSEITSLAGASWSDRLPRLVQARMVTALSGDHVFKSVGGGGSKAAADIIVSSEVRAFQIEALPGTDAAHVAINVRLIEDRNGKVVGTQLFDVSRQVKEKTTEASVAALNGAFGDVLAQIADWSVATLDPKGHTSKAKSGRSTPELRKRGPQQPGLVSQYDPRTQ